MEMDDHTGKPWQSENTRQIHSSEETDSLRAMYFHRAVGGEAAMWARSQSATAAEEHSTGALSQRL